MEFDRCDQVPSGFVRRWWDPGTFPVYWTKMPSGNSPAVTLSTATSFSTLPRDCQGPVTSPRRDSFNSPFATHSACNDPSTPLAVATSTAPEPTPVHRLDCGSSFM